MKNRIKTLFEKDTKKISIYFTAGFPSLENTLPILIELEKSGVDFVEIGLPFSDPLADGPVIQASSTQALENGMTTELLFDQLKNVREKIQIPLILMGYFNPILQFGVENFCAKCEEIGIDGLIIPDLPIDVFQANYQETFEKHNLINIFLITPQTSEKRIRYIDEISDGFIYLVSSASVTGAKTTFGNAQTDYFERIEKLNLKNPTITGFGISNRETYDLATRHSQGAIIGSAFVQFIKENKISEIEDFVKLIRSN